MDALDHLYVYSAGNQITNSCHHVVIDLMDALILKHFGYGHPFALMPTHFETILRRPHLRNDLKVT